ncbi:MAG TPA: hypothetical protein DEW35_05265 [Ruminococcaceae bacterium]|nr:hypothetical protein [Oscillospiraceae bacterium]
MLILLFYHCNSIYLTICGLTLLKKFVEWIKSKLPNYAPTLQQLENKWLELVKETEVSEKETTAEDSGVRYSIGVLENGNTFVIGDRNIITAADVSGIPLRLCFVSLVCVYII